MILNDNKILDFISKGKISIKPFSQSNLRPSSYCLMLDNTIQVFQKSKKRNINLLDPTTYPPMTKIEISKSSPYLLKPGELILGNSIECIALSKNVSGLLSNISGLARLGLNVLLSTHVSSGFGENNPKKIVFEIYNHSKFNIEIIPNVRICHIVFIKNISSSISGYDELFPSKYKQSIKSEYYK